MPEKTYTRDEIVALLGGSMANLPRDLEVRDSGIWRATVDDADLQDLTDTERAALRTHPNHRPTTEPLLQFPDFTAQQFLAFEDCVHIFRTVYLVGEVTLGRDLVEKLRWPESVRWTGLNDERIASLRTVSPLAAELASVLLNPPSTEPSSGGAASPPTAMPSTQPQPQQMHTTAGRRDLLTPIIERAQKELKDKFDTAAVWVELEDLARKSVPPLFHSNSGGVHYRDGGQNKTFTKRSLHARLVRAMNAQAGPAKPR